MAYFLVPSLRKIAKRGCSGGFIVCELGARPGPAVGVVCLPGKQKEELCVMNVLAFTEVTHPFQKLG